MKRSTNYVRLIGNVGREADVKHTANGTTVANFTIATSERWKGKNEEWQEKTEWHNIVAWRDVAEFAAEHVTRGALVEIEGKLETTKYEKDGQTHYATKIVASEIFILQRPAKSGGTERATQPSAPEPAQSEQIEDTLPF